MGFEQSVQQPPGPQLWYTQAVYVGMQDCRTGAGLLFA